MDATSKSGDAGLRYCLLLFNFILVVSGLLVIGFLLLALHHHAVAGYAYTASVGLILLVGGLTFLVGVMACFVAIHPTRRMLLLEYVYHHEVKYEVSKYFNVVAVHF